MKVYFTAATSYDGELHELYTTLISTLQKEHMEIVSGHQVVDQELLKKDKERSSDEIYRRERQLIETADLIVAEVSRPSLGVGSEIVYALSIGKPVLALVYFGYEDKISPIVAGNPSENLFLEFYSLDNIISKIHNFKHYIGAIKQVKKVKGKLIVIEGGDGSGKTTQAKLLLNYLKMHSVPVQYYDFPQYYTTFHGNTVAKFLRGEFGDIDQVSPYLASLSYALDRASVKQQMVDFLRKGGYIIANRYVTSNIAHQTAKLKTKREKKDFAKWVKELEYNVHKIPKEDLVVYLYVPWKIGMELTEHKQGQDYLLGKKDIHEKDIRHRQAAEEMYLELAKKNKHWVKVDCVIDGKLLSKEEIHKKVTEIVQNVSPKS